MYSLIIRSTFVVLLIWLSQSEYNPLHPAEHIYEIFPTRKIYKMNFQWECAGWNPHDVKKNCEEGPGVKLIRFYRKLHNGTLRETLTMKWDPQEDSRTMWLNTTWRSLNDYIELKQEVPLDLWDYDYADEELQTSNMSIQLTGSHILMWYNDYKISYIWLRDMAEDILYTTHVKFEKGFYFPEGTNGSAEYGLENKKKWKNGSLYWYYGDESMWCWEQCSQNHVYNFSGYYDEVLSPRTDEYQFYEGRENDVFMNATYCKYYNCTRRWENHPRCLMINFTVTNTSSFPPRDEILLDLSCINDTYDLEAEVKRAVEYWKVHNITNMRRSNWTQDVPDDPTGVGIVNGIYKCLQRDYCHDLRPFQLFNFEGSAHILSSDVLLVLSLVTAAVLLQLQ